MMRAAIGGILAGSIIAFAAPSTKAQEAPAYGGSLKDTPVYIYNWSGIYGGVHAGGEWGTEHLNFIGAGIHNTTDFDGGVVGGQLGVQYQFYNNLVLGAEASYTGMGTSGGNSFCLTPAFRCTASAADAIQVVGRLGYGWGNFMPYFKGGYANVSLRSTARPVVPGFDDGNRHDGWVLGGGLEYAYQQDIILGVHYSHIEADTVTYSPGELVGTIRDVDGTIDMVTARVSFKLGWTPAPAPMK